MKQKKFPVTLPARLLLAAGLQMLSASGLASPVISEFLASNPGLDTDSLDLPSDWIEIHNPDDTAVNLSGWSLSDNLSQPKKWVFPNVTLPAGGYLVLRASGANLTDPASQLHTNFSLRTSGGALGLFNPAGAPATVWTAYPKQFAGISYGLPAGGTADVWFTTPTPGAANPETGLTDYVRDTHFSLPRGFLNAPSSVTVTADTPGAEIRYTLNGSEPQVDSPLLSGPLAVSTTTVLRVRGFKSGLVPSNTDTRTWIFPSAWIAQPDAPAGFPPTWGNPFRGGRLDPVLKVLADYGMDPAVTSDPGITASLTQTLPVVCVTGDVEDLFGADGINGNGRRTGVEKPVAVEYFNPADPADRFSTRATLQAHGGGVKEFAKKAFRLDFSGTESDGALHYPLFAGSSSEVFDQLVLRSGGQDSFTVSPAAGLTSLDQYDLAGHGSYLRDQFLRRTENEMGLLSPRGRYVHLCLNGLYWGLYDLHERPNARYAAGYEGGAEADWDVLHHPQTGTGQEVVDGDTSEWTELQALSALASTPQDFAALKNLTGPDDLIDHLLTRIWAGDFDWLGPAYMPGNDGVNPTGNIAFYQNKNWYALRRSRGANPGPWQFFTWDGEISMGSHLLRNWVGSSTLPDNFSWPVAQRQLNFDFTGINRENTPAAPWAALLKDPEYRLHAADRMRRHFFNQGALSPAKAQARLRAMIQELDAPILAESARWGDVSGWTVSNLPGVGLVSGWKNQRITREGYWRPETAWLRDTFAVQRAGIVIGQFRARGIYPAVDAADIAPFGGALSAGSKITLTKPDPAAALYYTTDGNDPRIPGSGAVAPTATLTVGEQITPPAVAPFTLKTRVLKDGVWSALTEALFSSAVPPGAAALAITEINYHPASPSPAEMAAGFTDADLFEFLEITNRSDQTIALDSLRFAAGIDFDFASGSRLHELAPGASLVVAGNHDAFVMRYGFEPAGVFANGTRLDNSGEQLKLVSADGTVIADITYRDDRGWPEAADGGGKSLTLLAPASGSDGSTASQWRAATPTPGTVASTLSFADWRTDFFTPAELLDPLVSGPMADPDHDGLANILEYLTVSDPRKFSPNPVIVSQPGPGTIRFEWPLRPDATGPVPTLELSPELQTWTVPGTATAIPTTRALTLQRLDQPSSAVTHFCRLAITVQP